MESKALCSKLNTSDNNNNDDISSTYSTTFTTTTNYNNSTATGIINSSTQQQHQQQQQQQLIMLRNLKKKEMKSNLIRDITRVITHWVLINGELIKLLQCSLNIEEKEIIEEVLLQLANHDITRIDNYHQHHHQNYHHHHESYDHHDHDYHAVGINACIGFMLQETKYNDAYKVCMYLYIYVFIHT